jgi:hypothetical protein
MSRNHNTDLQDSFDFLNCSQFQSTSLPEANGKPVRGGETTNATPCIMRIPKQMCSCTHPLTFL